MATPSEDKSLPESEYAQNLELARLAESSERFEDMAQYVHALAEAKKELSIDERNLLSIAYKNVVGSQRASWRFLMSFIAELRESGTEDPANEHHIQLAQELKQKVEASLRTSSKQVIDLLVNVLLPNTESNEVQVFYYKMAGDYYRYNSEFTEGEERQNNAGAAYDNYHEATELVESTLPPTHPLRLGLALNFSVFYYEALNSPSRACKLAEKAYNDAMPELNSLPEELYHDSKLIMNLLRDNLTFWRSEVSENNKEDLFKDEEEDEEDDEEKDETKSSETKPSSETKDTTAVETPTKSE